MLITKTKNRKKSFIVIASVIAVVIAGGVVAYALTRPKSAAMESASSSGRSSQPSGASSFDTTPATPQDQSNADQTKNDTADKDKQTYTPSMTAQISISYIDTSSSTVDASAVVTSPYEDGGTCTYTLTMGVQTVTRQVSASKDAKSIICQGISVNKSDLSQGTWSMKVAYSSSTASGTSNAKSFEVN